MNAHLAEYQDIQEQIRLLQERATLLVMEGRAEAIDSIMAMVKIYNITAGEVGLDRKPAGPSRKRPPRSKKDARPPKYKDPQSDSTWTGQGREPKWLEGVPVNERDAYLVEQPAAPPVQQPPASWPDHLRVAGADPVRGPE